ncbi:MAG: glucose-6-phosphate isomerase, partial [Planctomycetes bacterium]|nr:glucose-6-phosphate isomerase [Planctomycetota bacterium]
MAGKKTLKITLDYNNVLTDAVGKTHGLTAKAIDGIAARTPKIAATLAAQRAAGKLPYRDLPYRDDYVKAITASVARKRGRFDNVVVLGIGGSALGA